MISWHASDLLVRHSAAHGGIGQFLCTPGAVLLPLSEPAERSNQRRLMGTVAPPADTAGMDTACTRSNVFIVEDSPAIRVRLVEMLGNIEGVDVVGEADSPAAAIEGILRTRPHSVVLDIHLAGGSGIDVLRRIHPVEPDIVFIVVTNHPNAQYRRIYTQAGASFFLDKAAEFEKVGELVANIGTTH